MDAIPCPECGARMSPDGPCPGCGFRLPAEDARRCLGDRGTPTPGRPGFSPGVGSCVVAVVAFGLAQASYLADAVHGFGEALAWAAGSEVGGLLGFGSILLALIGLALGGPGLAEAVTGRERFFCVTGLVLNALVLLSCCGLFFVLMLRGPF